MKGTIGQRTVQALKPGQILWDDRTTGFCVRRQRGEARTYYVKTEHGWVRIGRHGAPWTPDTARDKAKSILGQVADGRNPVAERKAVAEAETMEDLFNLYLGDCESGTVLTKRGEAKKPATLACDRGRVERHLRPLLGKLKVAAVTSHDVERCMHDIADGKTAGKIQGARRMRHARGGRGAAKKATATLSAIFTYAIKHAMRTGNPVLTVTKFADNRRHRRLSDAEYRVFGETLRKGEAEGTLWRPSAAVTRFLLLTGWRRSEALLLRWCDVDFVRRTAILPDTKTGRSVRALSHAACDVLRSMTDFKKGEMSVFFPPLRGHNAPGSFHNFWSKFVRLAELPAGEVTPHTLRHSFASLAADLGLSELAIGQLIGHKSASVTARYVHGCDAVLLAAADRVADHALELMGEAPRRGEVVELAQARA
jgi:integrase